MAGRIWVRVAHKAAGRLLAGIIDSPSKYLKIILSDGRQAINVVTSHFPETESDSMSFGEVHVGGR